VDNGLFACLVSDGAGWRCGAAPLDLADWLLP